MKGQAAIEYLMVAGFVIAIMVAVFSFAVFYSADSVASAQAQDAVNAIAKMADSAYSTGKGSFLKTTVALPEGVVSSSVNGKFVTITIRTSAGTSTIVASTIANVNGSIPSTRGVFAVSANMTDPNVTLRQV